MEWKQIKRENTAATKPTKRSCKNKKNRIVDKNKFGRPSILRETKSQFKYGRFFSRFVFLFCLLIRSAHFVSTREIRSVIAMAIRFIRWMPLTKIEMILVFVFFAFFSYLKKSRIKVFFSINNNYRIFVLKCFQYSISQMTLESGESKCTLTEAWDEFNSLGLTRNIFINAGNEKYFE